ncbi:MAG: hypothetical protein O2809_09500 [Proteobacteria bacterium]|nr:hypothetical protein [Pseudomonadota bacterium]
MADNISAQLCTKRYIRQLRAIQVTVILAISALLAVQWLVFKDTGYQCFSFMLFLGYLLYAYSYKNHSLSISLGFEIKGNSGKVNRLKCLIHQDAETSTVFRKALVQILDATGSIHVIDVIKIIESIDHKACSGKPLH